MEYFGEGLYLIFFTLAANFAYRIRGRNLGSLLEENGHAHHQGPQRNTRTHKAVPGLNTNNG